MSFVFSIDINRLMGWIQSKIPDMPITNFTNDWNDGRAVGALVDAVAPGSCHFLLSYFCYFSLTYMYTLVLMCGTGLCPDWSDWDPKDALQNATEAMGLADDWLKIPQVC